MAAPKPPGKRAGEILIAEAASLLMLTAPRLYQLMSSGDIPRGRVRGVVSLVGCVQGYINFLRRSHAAGSRTAAEDRIRNARAREIELRNAHRNLLLIDTDEAIALCEEIVGMVRSELSGLATRITRDRRLRAQLDSEFSDVLNRLAARFEQASRDLRTTGEASADDEAIAG